MTDWSVRLVIVLVALGFPIAVIMGWMFDLGPGGLAREDALSAVPASRAIAAAPDTPAASVPAPAAAPDVQATPTASAPFEDRRTIAVLPFVNMSGEAENEYFSDGIPAQILNLLTLLPPPQASCRPMSFPTKDEKH